MQTKPLPPPVNSEAWPNWFANEFGVSVEDASERQQARIALIDTVLGRLMNRCSTETIPGISIVIGETEVSYIAAEKPLTKVEKSKTE